jgi:hypothetical protein
VKVGTSSPLKLTFTIVFFLAALFYAGRRFIFTGESGGTATRVPGVKAQKNNPLDPALRTNLLKGSEDTKYEGRGRNIFRAEAAPPKELPKPTTQVMTNPQPQGPPPPPPINLKFFGFANQTGSPRRVFLANNDGDVFVASEGDVVQRRYKIVKINNNNIEVQDVLSNNRQTIPLTAG